MRNRRSFLPVVLLGFAMLSGRTTIRACRYCWSAERAASEYTQQSMLPKGPADNPPGAFPLDGTITQFTPAAAPSALATQPSDGSIVTSAAGLRPATAPTASASAMTQPAHAAGHYADAGLLGLAAVGGVFCWRTRRKTGSER